MTGWHPDSLRFRRRLMDRRLRRRQAATETAVNVRAMSGMFEELACLGAMLDDIDREISLRLDRRRAKADGGGKAARTRNPRRLQDREGQVREEALTAEETPFERPTREQLAEMHLAALHALRRQASLRILELARRNASAAPGDRVQGRTGADDGRESEDAGSSRRGRPAEGGKAPGPPRRAKTERPGEEPKAWELAVMEGDRALDGMDLKLSAAETLLREVDSLTTRQVAERMMAAAGRNPSPLAMTGITRRLSIILFRLEEEGHLKKSGTRGRSLWKARTSLRNVLKGPGGDRTRVTPAGRRADRPASRP